LTRCRGLINLVDQLFFFSLANWFFVFIWIGFSKYNPHSFIPLGLGVVGILMTVGGITYMDSCISWTLFVAKYIRQDGVDHPENNVQERVTVEMMGQYDGRQTSFSNIAFNVLFLGGFGYNAVLFFTFQNLPYDKPYLVLMSISFACSLTIVSWTSFYNLHFVKCSTDLEKYYLHKSTDFLYRCVSFLAYIVILSLLLAFTMIGYVKFKAYYPHSKMEAPIMTCGAIVSILVCHIIIFFIYNSYKSVLADGEVRESLLNDKGDFSYRRLVNQIGVAAGACSFIAGNVCYEILFSVAISPKKYEFADFLYFTLLNYVFGAGTAVVAATTTIDYFLQRLSTENQRQNFGLLCKRIKYVIFFLTVSSLFAWMGSIIFMGLVKYTDYKPFNYEKGNLYWPSFVLGIFGCVCFLHMTYNLKSISNVIYYKEHTLIDTSNIDKKNEA